MPSATWQRMQAQQVADPLFAPALPLGRDAALLAALLRSTIDPAMAAARPQVQRAACAIVSAWGVEEAEGRGERVTALVVTVLEGLPDPTAAPEIAGALVGSPACEALCAAVATDALASMHSLQVRLSTQRCVCLCTVPLRAWVLRRI